MQYPGRPERFYQALTGTLVLTGLGCMFLGDVINHHLVARVGWWLSVTGIFFAFVPLVLFLIVLVVEQLRR